MFYFVSGFGILGLGFVLFGVCLVVGSDCVICVYCDLLS